LLQGEADNDSRINYSPELECTHNKPEVTFYPQGRNTPSSSSMASGKLK